MIKFVKDSDGNQYELIELAGKVSRKSKVYKRFILL
jgi:hypothetical protein